MVDVPDRPRRRVPSGPLRVSHRLVVVEEPHRVEHPPCDPYLPTTHSERYRPSGEEGPRRGCETRKGREVQDGPTSQGETGRGGERLECPRERERGLTLRR